MKFNKKLTFSLGAFILISFLIFWQFYKEPSYRSFVAFAPQDLRQIKIKDQIFKLEVADTLAKKQKGLADRESMPQNYGMIFIFEKKGIYSFWMKEMRFPLDFLWIDGDKIVEITRNVPVPSDEDFLIYQPQVPVNKVIELNAGMAAAISLGDKIVEDIAQD